MFPVHQVWPKPFCKGTVKGGRRQGRQKEEVGRQHQGMDRPGIWQVPEDSWEQGKIEKTGCKIICGAPTTLAVKGLMMMMMRLGVLVDMHGNVHTFSLAALLIQSIYLRADSLIGQFEVCTLWALLDLHGSVHAFSLADITDSWPRGWQPHWAVWGVHPVGTARPAW